ncbi:aminotransferase class IV [Abyssalbus ytuae]|uniref:branched-chain-amino-acid transaminase n=1 Tax=Abyssalbus ytuae TaxID=2926907 RepID=A0A9E7A152_9FLAO|nr:aminotransferase class IV [Abyssalbus ytuae]UOB17841.1 aminotransferase class IV [Abyssalbus ytuae]
MINFNGKIFKDDDLFLNHTNRALKYGDALFETIKVVNSKIFFLEDHYFRLMASMRILRMKIPDNFTMEFFENEMLTTIQSNHKENLAVRVRFTVFRDAKGYYLPHSNNISYIVETDTIDAPFYLLNEKKHEIELYKDYFINSGLLSTLKTNNRIINVIAGIYANENDYDNCLLLNENKNVVEAVNGNIFVISGKTIITPPLTEGCINGILRKQLLNIIDKTNEYTIEERAISPFELQKADELFITNVIKGIQPVTKFRKKQYSNEVGKDLLKKLNVAARLI